VDGRYGGRVHAQLDLEGLPRPLVRVTPAKLAAWTSCPRRYRMAYLDRPAPSRGASWAHNTLGAVVHTALRVLFGLPRRRRDGAAAAALVAAHWSGEGFADAPELQPWALLVARE
jgi:putative RecB family exonuclease